MRFLFGMICICLALFIVAFAVRQYKDTMEFYTETADVLVGVGTAVEVTSLVRPSVLQTIGFVAGIPVLLLTACGVLLLSGCGVKTTTATKQQGENTDAAGSKNSEEDIRLP